MFVFAPGAGCNGPKRLVKPGDELIFSSSYNPSDWVSDNTGESALDEKGLASTCPAGKVTAMPWSFKAPLANNDLRELSNKTFSDDTMRKVRWARKMFREWRAHREESGGESIGCDLEDATTISEKSLVFALCRFITEVKKINGEEYPGKTLYDIIICLQFHLECQGFSFKLINGTLFRDVKFTLDNCMKARTAQGIGISIKQAQVLSATDEDYLWSLGFLGMSFPDQLLNTVVFAIGKGFALRAGQEHLALRAIPFNSQLTFMRDPDGEIYLRYTEDIGLKTNKGGLKHRRVMPKTVDLYSAINSERCPLVAILKYMSLLPKTRTCPAFLPPASQEILREIVVH